MNGADWLLAALATEGMPYLFGNPGSTELPITDALGRQDAVHYVLALHEAVAMGMADGYAQTTGGPAAVNVHVQPGLANAMSGLLNAARCRVPLIVTVGQQVQSLLAEEPFLGGELVELARPIAKGAWQVADPQELAETFSLAVRTALEHPRGPVVLAIPLDVQLAPAPAPHVRVVPAVPPPPPAEALDAAATLLAAARAPVVLAGDGVAHAAAGDALAALAERLGAPILGEPTAATVPLATDHPLWRGPLPPFAAQIHPALAPYDVVVAVGMPVFRLFGHSPGPALPDHVALVHLEVDPHEVGKVHTPAIGLVGEIEAGLTGLLERLGPPTPACAERLLGAATETARLCATAVRQLTSGVDANWRIGATEPTPPPGLEEAPPGERVSPGALAMALAGAISPDDLVVDEALTSGRSLRVVIGPRTPDTWLAHRGSALGWGLPAAVGAAMARPARRVMVLQGDGGLLFGISALWTAAHEGVGLALVVADNAGYEILRAGLEGLTGRPDGRWPGLRLHEPRLDIEAICRGFGARAERVDDPAALGAALADLWARAEDGPAVLVVGVEGRTAPVGYPIDV